MNTKDQLYQAKQGRSYQTLRRELKLKLSNDEVKAVFESDQPDQRHLKLVCEALGVEYETPILGIAATKNDAKPATKPNKPKVIEGLRKEIDKVQGRDKKTLALAKGQSCVKCGINDGTIVSAHLNGILQHKLGQGMGCKVNDNYTAFLCHSCHTEMDQRNTFKTIATNEQKMDQAIEWLLLIIETLLIKLNDHGKESV